VRFRRAPDSHHAYVNDFPEGKYRKAAQRIYERMNSRKTQD